MFGLVFILALIASLAGASAFAFDVMVPKMEPRRRALLAALVGALLPMLIPIAALLLDTDSVEEILLPIVVLAILGVILAAAVGFPAAYWVTRWRARVEDADAFR